MQSEGAGQLPVGRCLLVAPSGGTALVSDKHRLPLPRPVLGAPVGAIGMLIATRVANFQQRARTVEVWPPASNSCERNRR
jgi:hypothetical protein